MTNSGLGSKNAGLCATTLLAKRGKKEETLAEGPMGLSSLFPRLYAQASQSGGFFLKFSLFFFFLEDELGCDF